MIPSDETGTYANQLVEEFSQNKAKWFAKQLASLVYQFKAKVLEIPSKQSDTLNKQ